MPCAPTLSTNFPFLSQNSHEFSFFIYIFTTHVFLHTQQTTLWKKRRKPEKYFPNDCFSLRLCLLLVGRDFPFSSFQEKSNFKARKNGNFKWIYFFLLKSYLKWIHINFSVYKICCTLSSCLSRKMKIYFYKIRKWIYSENKKRKRDW